MKKKFLLVGGALAVGALALSSCGSKTRERAKSKELPAATEFLDVSLTYGANNLFITASNNFNNPIENNAAYVKGQTLLPVWRKFAKVLSESEKYGVGTSVTIRDGIKHEKKKPADRFATDRSGGFKTTNESNEGQDIDLYQNTTENINKMGAAGECLNLLDYIDYMPNFKAYLDANPVLEDQMTVDGKIYYTPYMDGSNYYERMFQMDAAMTKKLLDHGKDVAFDTASATSENRINFTANKVTPFINATKNYASDNFEVQVSVGGKAKTVKVKQTDNIIAQQNALLTDSTKTGADLAKQFIDYLTTAYGDIEVDGTKLYSTLSNVFVGESAIYNTDDLIALFRVFRANPDYISGGLNASIYPFQIRTSEDNRVENVLSLAGNLFGVQGLNSEKDRLFFTTDGFWADAATEKQSYDALARMNALYQEGLILKGFQQGSKTPWGTMAFQRNTSTATYGLMLNDYTAVPSKMNAVDANGVGTSTNDNYTSSELQPILAPITWWSTESFTHGQDLTTTTGKTLTRYYEEIRSLKDESWCVPSNSDNKLAAIKLMDYLMAKEGQVYYDFCTEEYWATDASNTSGEFPGYVEFTYGGDTTPQLKQEVLNWYTTSPISDFNDFWKFMRGALGCTFGIGYIRTSTIDYQSTNTVARGGADALKAATNAGVNLKPNLISEVKFGTAVPAAGYPEITNDISKQYDAITQFWTNSKKGQTNETYGFVAAIQDPNFGDNTVLGTLSQDAGGTEYKYSDVTAQFETRNKSYLKKFAEYYATENAYGKSYGKVPSYTK